MGLPLFHLDAFARRRFEGNPAAVMVMPAWPDDAVLQAHAAEHRMPETAFLVRDGADYRLRWFTPTVEIPLCGHATLASAAVVFERLEPSRTAVTFHSASGPLHVRRAMASDDGQAYVMDFPLRRCRAIDAPAGLAAALCLPASAVVAVAHDGVNVLVQLADEASVRRLAPDLAAVAHLPDAMGLIVTAVAAAPYDFVSRFFTPQQGIPEDPVTGSTHCALAHYWSGRIGRPELRAWQASARGGEVVVRLRDDDRVELEGRCVFYSEGQLC